MKNSGYRLADLPPRLRAQIEGLTPSAPIVPHGSAGPRLRQDTKGPNKTEAAFAAYLRILYPEATIKEQDVTIRIANGVRYTPDIFVRFKLGDEACFETKGFIRDDSAVKIKVAAAAYPFWKFYLVKAKDRSLRSWDIQHILP